MLAKITTSITRNYGAETVTFGAEVEVELSGTDEQRRVAYERLYLKIADVHKHYAANLLPKVPNSKAQQPQQPQQPQKTEEMPTARISVETKAGKTYYKIHGGRYIKHGVRVWDEVLAPHFPDGLPEQDTVFVGHTATITFTPEGKTDRVKGIRRNV